ncbi:tetratricopeptide repeat protein [Aquirhabdus parva]|uniref:Tetratricopeptide repeat protein n=1 Tax=Aquirhabdus parva TaxID=2283318 RepID=A0A345P2R0_9GAMM|nr:hypothetical protein [Aquirhabdus parva]AXI01569.1 hypothetical protein HYN46_00845 [Aquirhabdus parva]
MRQRLDWAKFLSISLLAFAMTQTWAEVYRPAQDSEVIDTLPAGSPTFQSRTRLISSVQQPFTRVEPEIRTLLAQSYAQGDPRALGQAESLIEPYNKETSPSVRILRANILQASHRFDDAKAELQAILKSIPNQPDALLMLSSIDLVQGHFDEARGSCDHLRDMGLLVLRFACFAQIDAMTGKLQESRDTLLKLKQMNNGLTTEQQRWINLMLADIALRLNDAVLAKSVFEQLDIETAPSLMARADWLIAHHEWEKTQRLLASHTENDSLLLRLVMSEVRLKDPQASAHFKLLSERIRVWNERGETAHQREEAMYALMLRPPEKSLALARTNWQKQRETADVGVYANAALYAHSRADLQVIQDWIKKTGFEYPRLTQVVAQALQAGH